MNGSNKNIINLEPRIHKLIKILGIDNFISEMDYWFDKDLLDDFIESVEDEYNIK